MLISELRKYIEKLRWTQNIIKVFAWYILPQINIENRMSKFLYTLLLTHDRLVLFGLVVTAAKKFCRPLVESFSKRCEKSKTPYWFERTSSDEDHRVSGFSGTADCLTCVDCCYNECTHIFYDLSLTTFALWRALTTDCDRRRRYWVNSDFSCHSNYL